MLARIFIEQNNIDSAYYYSKKAFYNMPNVNPHRYTFFRILQDKSDSEELDKAFKEIKYRGSPDHWYDYIYTKFKLKNNDEELLSLIEEFKDLYPNEDFRTINEINNFISIGSEAYTLSAAISILADEKFTEEKYSEAANLYERSIYFNPDEYLYFENAAISYDLTKQYDKASEYYDVVLDKFKTTDGRTEFYKGLMLVKTNKQKEGCELLKIASSKKFVLKTTGISAVSVYPALCSRFSND
jgi:tetratricopeptide (TPR) repeat protein